MRSEKRYSFSCSWLLVVFCACWPLAAQAQSGVIDAEVGRDIGDGHVRYNTPYDPKRTEAVTFVSPSPQHPFYEIVLPLGELNEGPQTTLHAVRVNGVPADSFYVFVDGMTRSLDLALTTTNSAARNVVVVTRSVWHNGEPTTVEIDFGAKAADGQSRRFTRTLKATAPAHGGAPAGWRRYQSVLLEEKAGLDRSGEPVEFSLTDRAEYAGDLQKELRVFQIDPEQKALKPVPFQLFNAQAYPGSPPGTREPWEPYPGGMGGYIRHPVRSVEGVFLADVPARQSRVYVMLYDNPAATVLEPPATDLKVTGSTLGATVENRFYTARLSDKSGLISSMQLRSQGQRTCPVLTNSINHAVHWNPDSYGDNGAWGHVFGWNPPEQVVVSARGPILFRVTLSGRMPDYTPQIHASVSYSFYTGTPYVRVTTVTQVRDPYAANAVRNGELVLDTHLVDHFAWEEKTGEVKRMRTRHGPNFQDEWAARVDHDAHWLAMTSENDGYGIGAAIINSLAFNPQEGEAATHRPAYYLYCHHMWRVPLTYFTRAWVYPFSDFQKGPNLPVAPGSTYLERMGIMPFYLGEGGERYKDIATAAAVLRHPLSQQWGR